jgi:hypothetical protein
LDRLGWADGLAFVSYGVRIGIRVSQPDLMALVQPALPPLLRVSRKPVVDHLFSIRAGGESQWRGLRHFHQLYLGAARLTRSLDLDELIVALEGHLRLLMAAMAPHRVFVHAGVVGWKGRAVLLPGPSHCGKSALVAELLRAGATYYSDEYAVLDDRGHVHPYPCRLSLRQPVTPTRVLCSAAELGAPTGARSLPVGLLLFTRYDRQGPWAPRRLTPGEATMLLLRNAVAARVFPGRVLTTVAHLTRTADALESARGEAAAAAQQVLTAAEAVDAV